MLKNSYTNYGVSLLKSAFINPVSPYKLGGPFRLNF